MNLIMFRRKQSRSPPPKKLKLADEEVNLWCKVSAGPYWWDLNWDILIYNTRMKLSIINYGIKTVASHMNEKTVKILFWDCYELQ